MSVFSPAELLALEPSDLRGLMDLADGDGIAERAATLGLDIAAPAHCRAVMLAYPEVPEWIVPTASGPVTVSGVLGTAGYPSDAAGQTGVRQDLTPPGTSPAHGTHGHPEPPQTLSDGFSGPADLAAHMAAHKGTGTPFLAGTFALYAAPDGSVVMVTETTQAGIRRDVMPAKLVRMALGLAAGQGGGIMGRLFGRG